MNISIDLNSQTLSLEKHGQEINRFLISSAANGAGEQNNSFCTPRGRHIVRAKIGHGLKVNTVLVGRRPTGERYQPALRARFPKRDWILTRILWLSGCEPGLNRNGSVDTMRRYIYIHGTPDDVKLGQVGSHGCIRMRNSDIIFLFDQIPVGTPVLIHE